MTTRAWTRPDQVIRELERRWDSGALLRAALEGPTPFPLRLPIRGPDATDLSERWEEVRHWALRWEESSRAQGYTLTWRERAHRQLGRNRLPEAAVIPTEEIAWRLLCRSADVVTARELAEQIREAVPVLMPWFIQHTIRALEVADDWGRLISVLRWFQAHPRSGVYLRQIDLPGVDTKFIETRRGLIAELLDHVLPPAQIDPSASGTTAFERRYGLRARPALVRFRVLDPALTIGGLTDLTVPSVEFAALSLRVRHVAITENEINGLAWPQQPESMVIFGLGYAVDRLFDATWLNDVALTYWGDLDTHGFAMLSRLRGLYPHATSLLMDRETLLAHRALWVTEERPFVGELTHLDAQEQALYDDLRGGAYGKGVRLEQERIGYDWVTQRLRAHDR